MSLAREIMAKVAEYREEFIEAQRVLVAQPALGPLNQGQGEVAKCLIMEDFYRKLGLSLERVDAPDDRVENGIRPNLVGTMPGGDGPAVWALGHLDVVPVGELSLWDTDPWELVVDGDRIYGRGVIDNHNGLLCPYFGLKALLDLGITPAGPVGLLAVADEETGSLYGLDYLLRQRLELFSPQDLITVPDAGNEDGSLIEVAEKSILWMKVEVVGVQVHASKPQLGKNALMASARMITAVREVRSRFGLTDDLFNPPGSTMEPTRKEAGVSNINTVPGKDIFYIDCRVLPTVPLEEVEKDFAETFGRIAEEEGVKVEISLVQRQPAAPPTPADAPVVKALGQAIRQVRQVEPMPGGIGGGTVAAFFRERGLAAAVWNTTTNSAHMPNEYANMADLIKDAQVFALLFAGCRNRFSRENENYFSRLDGIVKKNGCLGLPYAILIAIFKAQIHFYCFISDFPNGMLSGGLINDRSNRKRQQGHQGLYARADSGIRAARIPSKRRLRRSFVALGSG